MTEEELKALLAEGAQAGVLEDEEHDMIERVLRLADKPVRAIMTPRTDLVWIDRTDYARGDRRDAEIAHPHSRFMVCDGAVDNVVGVVRAKDMLDRILDGGELSVAAALRQPIVVPDTMTALDALERLKSDPLGLALVMDEYGSFEGVVTAADVLEAIVGDPADAARPRAAPGESSRWRSGDGRDDAGRRAEGPARACRICLPRAAITPSPGCCSRSCAACLGPATGSSLPAGASRSWRWTDGASTRCGPARNRWPKLERDAVPLV